MTDEQLEELLRTTLERDATRVPLAHPEWDGIMRLRHHHAPPQPRRLLRLSIAAALMLAFVASVAVATRFAADGTQIVASPPPATTPAAPTTLQPPTPSSTTTSPVPFVTTIVPTVTLPSPPGTAQPPTSVVGAPTAYYRFAPDLDLAWTDQGRGPEICWRTPIDEQCVLDAITGPDQSAVNVVPSSANLTLVLVHDSHEDLARRQDHLIVTLANGESFGTPINWDQPDLKIGIVRIDSPADEIDSLTTAGQRLWPVNPGD